MPTIVAGLWLAGMAAAVLRWLAGYVRSIRAMSTAIGPDEASSRQWLSLLAEHGITRAIPLRLTARMGPLLCRWPDGYELVVPAEFWRSLAPAARESIMRHELAHYQRGDVWKSLVVRALALPHWFNPAAWWAVRRFEEAAEWACDEAAVVRGQKHTEFARTLVTLAEASLGGPPWADCHPAVGRWNLSARIGRLLNSSGAKDTIMKKLILGAIALVLLTVFLVRVDLVAKTPPEETEPQFQSEPRLSGSGIGAPSEPQPSEPGMSGISGALGLSDSEPQPAAGALPGGTRSVASVGHDAAPSTAPSRADLRAALDAQQLGLYLTQLSQVESDLRTLRADLTVARAVLQRLDKAPVNTLELQRLKLDDPICRELQKKIADLEAVRNQSAGKSKEQADRFSKQLVEQVNGLQAELNSRLTTLTETVTEAKRSELRERIEELAIKVEMAAESRAELEKAIQDLRKQLEETVRPTVAASAVSGVATSDARTRLRYEGRSFDEWKTSLESELSDAERTKAIQALAAFAPRGYGAEAARTIVRLMWEYAWSGSAKSLAPGNPIRAAYAAFSRIPPENALPALRGELNGGNDSSRRFAIEVLGSLGSASPDAAASLVEFIRGQKPSKLRTAALMAIFTADASAKSFVALAREALDRGPDPEEAEACMNVLTSRNISLQIDHRGGAFRLEHPLTFSPRNKTLLGLLADYADREKSPVRSEATLLLLYGLARSLQPIRADVEPNSLENAWRSLEGEVHNAFDAPLRRAVLAYARLDVTDRHDRRFVQEGLKRLVNEPVFLLWASDAAEGDDKELAQAVVLLLKECPPDESSRQRFSLSPALGLSAVPQQQGWWEGEGRRSGSTAEARTRPRIDVAVGFVKGADRSTTVGGMMYFEIQVANRTGRALTEVRVQCNPDGALRPTLATEGFQKEGNGVTWTIDSWPTGLTRTFRLACRNVAAVKQAACEVKATSAEGLEGSNAIRYEIRLPEPPEPKMVPIDGPSSEPAEQPPAATDKRSRTSASP